LTSYILSVDIECGNCEKIKNHETTQIIKRYDEEFSNRSTLCGKSLSIADLSIDVKKL
jgi:hypothetical protein